LVSERRTCPLCRTRRGKRLCPAKGEEICAHCCGTKRRVEIRCPDDCAYLDGRQAGAWEGRDAERRRDARRLAPSVQGLSETQARRFFLALHAIAQIHGSRGPLDDRLLGQALRALRQTFETRINGVLYEHPTEDARAQEIVGELSAALDSADIPEVGPPSDRDSLAVIAALEDSAARVIAEGGEPAAFIATILRLVGELGGGPAPQAPSVILEP
jgi:hypothetical protein